FRRGPMSTWPPCPCIPWASGASPSAAKGRILASRASRRTRRCPSRPATTPWNCTARPLPSPATSRNCWAWCKILAGFFARRAASTARRAIAGACKIPRQGTLICAGVCATISVGARAPHAGRWGNGSPPGSGPGSLGSNPSLPASKNGTSREVPCLFSPPVSHPKKVRGPGTQTAQALASVGLCVCRPGRRRVGGGMLVRLGGRQSGAGHVDTTAQPLHRALAAQDKDDVVDGRADRRPRQRDPGRLDDVAELGVVLFRQSLEQLLDSRAVPRVQLQKPRDEAGKQARHVVPVQELLHRAL